MMPMLDRARTGLAEPFRGIATNGEIVPGLFAINKTGVSLAALLEGARSFLFALTADKDKLGSISKEGDRYPIMREAADTRSYAAALSVLVVAEWLYLDWASRAPLPP